MYNDKVTQIKTFSFYSQKDILKDKIKKECVHRTRMMPPLEYHIKLLRDTTEELMVKVFGNLYVILSFVVICIVYF